MKKLIGLFMLICFSLTFIVGYASNGAKTKKSSIDCVSEKTNDVQGLSINFDCIFPELTEVPTDYGVFIFGNLGTQGNQWDLVNNPRISKFLLDSVNSYKA